MAYYDVLSAGAYGRFNRKLAKMTNLQTAVYWSELLDIVIQVVKKQKFNQEGYFKVDRTYIEEQTSISKEEQLLCDSILVELDVLEISIIDEDMLRVRLSTMEKLLISDSIKIVEKAKKKVNKVDKIAAKEGKKLGILRRLNTDLITLEPNDNLRAAYSGWLDVVYDKGVCKKSQLEIFINDINSYTDNVQVKLELIKIATSLGYKTAGWVINKYSPSNIAGTRQKTAEAVSSEISF